MPEVTLQEVLEARDARREAQERLLAEHGLPVISFTMNIPGPVKDSPLIRRCFRQGLDELVTALQAAGISAIAPAEKQAVTGCEFLCAADAPAARVKAITERVEDGSPLGRLFDMDVIYKDGRKLDRARERGCIVCGKIGRGCASRRLHPLEELTSAVKKRMAEGLCRADGARLGALVTESLLEEVDVTPKPGLVDRNNTGSHTDMDRSTFRLSAEALRPYWEDCFYIGAGTSAAAPEETFLRLRERGIQAEIDMLSATRGVNTHKGAVFLLGILCGAVGRLWCPLRPAASPEEICFESRRMVSAPLSRERAEIEKKSPAGLTAGEQQYLQYGIKGARGEAESGFSRVMETSLPVFLRELSRGRSRNEAAVAALLALISLGPDTNMIRRGGIEIAEQASIKVAELLYRNPEGYMQAAEKLDSDFIRANLSPGGYADLLSVTLLFDRLSQVFCAF